MTQETVFEESSGNVFADLGLTNADELFTRGQIGIQVLRLLKQRHLKQREISQLDKHLIANWMMVITETNN
jgi:predicted XRE-type DNA-binding protein